MTIKWFYSNHTIFLSCNILKCALHWFHFSVCLYSTERLTQRGIKAYQGVGATTLETCNIPAAVLQQCYQLVQKILLKIILPIVFLIFLKYVLLFYFYYSKSHDLRTRRIQPLRKLLCQLQDKRLANLVHCTESVRFENLVHDIFGNENSTMEINVRYFGVLHWQQWQPPASTPHFYLQPHCIRGNFIKKRC